MRAMDYNDERHWNGPVERTMTAPRNPKRRNSTDKVIYPASYGNL